MRRLDRDAVEVVRRLQRFDYSAYLVGGCVRDLLLDLRPKDFDVSTSARPEEIRKVFRNSRIIGRRFRLAHIYFRGGKIIETATFRGSVQSEEPPADGDLLITRDNVWGTEQEDAVRRDFTINALFYDVATGRIIDHVGGLDDIAARVVRTIGEPEIRVQEDPVRILRAARFAAKLEFDIEPSLEAAMVEYREEIKRCPQARVLEETFKLLRSGHAANSVRVLDRTQVLEVILPELASFLQDNRSEESEALLYGYLTALDELARVRAGVTDAVVLATILLMPLQVILQDVDPSEHSHATSEFITQVTERVAATRRVRERVRQIFTAQRHFAPPRGGKRPRRRVAASSLVKRSYFADALNLAEIQARAHGDDLQGIRTWRERAGDIEPEDDRPEAGDQPVKKKRRRRRRRRRSPAAAKPAE